MDRILVATDFSTRSDRALRRATLIAKQVDAALTLIHVVDIDQPERLIASDRSAASALLDETVRTLHTNDGIRAESLVAVNDVHSGILEAAEAASPDLIVLGPHRSRLTDVFVGTTVERVVRRTRYPLLVAIQTPSASYERTLLALDFDEASKSAGRAALDMGIFKHTDVIVMHAFEAPFEGTLRRWPDSTGAADDYVAGEHSLAVDKLYDLVRDLGLPARDQRVVGVNGTPARSILESARSEDSHLIVMGTNQRKGWERLLIGSVTEDVIRDPHRDVLIIPIDQA